MLPCTHWITFPYPLQSTFPHAWAFTQRMSGWILKKGQILSSFRVVAGAVEVLLSAVSFKHFEGGQFLQREKQMSPFRFPPDKLYNNHSVSRLPPGLRFQFCAVVPRRSHELTLKFCSRRRGSALQWPFDSSLLKQLLKGWTIIQRPRYPSLPATCGPSLMVLLCMSDEAAGAL